MEGENLPNAAKDSDKRKVPENKDDQQFWAPLLLDEFKYRHERYWKTLQVSVGAAIAVGIVPWVKTDLVDTLSLEILVFPIVSGFLALVAGILANAEAQRLGAVEKIRLEIRKKLECVEPRLKDGKGLLQRVAHFPIGSTVSMILIPALILANVANAYLLYHRVAREDVSGVSSESTRSERVR